MSSLNLASYTPYCAEILQDTLSRLNSILSQNALVMASSTEQSISRFYDLDPDGQDLIIGNIQKYIEVLGPETETERTAKTSSQTEIARLKKAAKAFGLRFLDDEIFKMIDGEDVVEIYDHRQIQIYRNMKFCNLCSYSLLDLAVHSWSELYEKPAYVTAAAGARVQEVMTAAVKPISYEMEPFIQREVLLYAKTLRTFHVKPKFLSPLVSEVTGVRAGFVTTFSAEVLAEGEDSRKYHII